ncbi:MAG: ribosome biogenesis GTP-binding protein YihA/YsxC [Leptospiraceae bacterium]|nr:YihA family ribosome biogenesis GTP-binding protein [Leptospiraceae bacterium]MCK6381080.1 ribosome biogenesis GTP-binding protein YihA/YsxC [Leptospiraceae bacterium]NUM42307.1 YihA family ribosome biogenesis GTP-binding protein [Leptospiraceae bacterium]
MINSKFQFQNVIFHSAYVDTKKIPQIESIPQFAFCGRSNSGKSSLINALCGRKKLVKVSSTPGKTKEINLFLAEDHFFFVDLPGFGFAKGSHQLRDSMIERVNSYLNHSKMLKTIFLLCDSARELPLEEENIIQTAFKKNIQPVLIRTKFDKLNQKEIHTLKKKSNEFQKIYPNLKIVFLSVKNSTGLKDIIEIIREK